MGGMEFSGVQAEADGAPLTQATATAPLRQSAQSSHPALIRPVPAANAPMRQRTTRPPPQTPNNMRARRTTVRHVRSQIPNPFYSYIIHWVTHVLV